MKLPENKESKFKFIIHMLDVFYAHRNLYLAVRGLKKW